MYLEKSSDIYEYLHEDVQFFLKSAARFKILLSLLESPRSLEEIRNSSESACLQSTATSGYSWRRAL